MKSSIKTCLAESERIVSLTKFTFCTAVILILGFTANLSAVPTIFLDADTLDTGSDLVNTPLMTPYGTITFSGQIYLDSSDPDFIDVGASGGTFDILGPHDNPVGDQTAELFFDFDVISIEFIYGGNDGSIKIEARDYLDNAVDSFFQGDTWDDEPAGPITLYGPGICSLYWEDTVPGEDHAALDNITITLIPSPSAVVLAGIGVSFVGWLRRRKVV